MRREQRRRRRAEKSEEGTSVLPATAARRTTEGRLRVRAEHSCESTLESRVVSDDTREKGVEPGLDPRVLRAGRQKRDERWKRHGTGGGPSTSRGWLLYMRAVGRVKSDSGTTAARRSCAALGWRLLALVPSATAPGACRAET